MMNLLLSLPKELLEIIISYLDDINIILKLYPEVEHNKFFWIDKINLEFDNFYLSNSSKIIVNTTAWEFHQDSISKSISTPEQLIDFYAFLTNTSDLQQVAYGRTCSIHMLTNDYLIIKVDDFTSAKVNQMISESFRLKIFYPRATDEMLVMDLKIYDSGEIKQTSYVGEEYDIEYKEYENIIKGAKKWIIVLEE
jgi:hypothetical protein